MRGRRGGSIRQATYPDDKSVEQEKYVPAGIAERTTGMRAARPPLPAGWKLSIPRNRKCAWELRPEPAARCAGGSRRRRVAPLHAARDGNHSHPRAFRAGGGVPKQSGTACHRASAASAAEAFWRGAERSAGAHRTRGVRQRADMRRAVQADARCAVLADARGAVQADARGAVQADARGAVQADPGGGRQMPGARYKDGRCAVLADARCEERAVHAKSFFRGWK